MGNCFCHCITQNIIMNNNNKEQQVKPSFLELIVGDPLVEVFSYLFPSEMQFCTDVLHCHNELVALHYALPSLQPLLRDYAHLQRYKVLSHPRPPPPPSEDDDGVVISSPFEYRMDLIHPDDVQSYHCSAETTGGTGREGIRNILRPGNYNWNKWFDPVTPLPSVEHPVFVRLTLNRPVRLVGYGVKSANDVPNRDPQNWQLQIIKDVQDTHQTWEIVHTIENEWFDQRYETHWYPILGRTSIATTATTADNHGTITRNNTESLLPPLTRSLRMNITKRRDLNRFGCETQIGQLYFLVLLDTPGYKM